MKHNNNVLGSTITLTVEQNTSINIHAYIHKLRIYLIILVVDYLKQQPSYSRNKTNWRSVRCLTSSACEACLVSEEHSCCQAVGMLTFPLCLCRQLCVSNSTCQSCYLCFHFPKGFMCDTLSVMYV